MAIERIPSEVALTGENPTIRLLEDPEGPPTTAVSFWRVVYSPAGPGHVLFILSGPLGETPSVYSDSVELARWLQREIELNPKNCDESLPVHPATFQKSGDPRSSWTETVTSQGTEISCTWHDIGEPHVHHFNPGDLPRPHEVYAMLAPAHGAEVRVNGEAVPGKVSPGQLAGAPFSTASLAFSETWLKPAQ